MCNEFEIDRLLSDDFKPSGHFVLTEEAFKLAKYTLENINEDNIDNVKNILGDIEEKNEGNEVYITYNYFDENDDIVNVYKNIYYYHKNECISNEDKKYTNKDNINHGEKIISFDDFINNIVSKNKDHNVIFNYCRDIIGFNPTLNFIIGKINELYDLSNPPIVPKDNLLNVIVLLTFFWNEDKETWMFKINMVYHGYTDEDKKSVLIEINLKGNENE